MMRRLLLAILAGAAAAIAVYPLQAEPDATQQARVAALRGLAFTVQDGANWRVTKKCASCHQGTATAWTLAEAKERGYPVQEAALAENFAWSRERFAGIDQPRAADPRTQTVNLAALQFGLMALTNPGQKSVPPAELERLGTHFLNTQQENGSWTWATIPAGNRPPPVFESDEVATLLAYLALEDRLPKEKPEASPVAASREKAARWLESTPAGDSTQAAALRLYVAARDRVSRPKREAALAALLARQNADGGWSQMRELPSDAYATGQALYFLQLSGVDAHRPEVKQGLAYLVAAQQEDGSWKVTPRAHLGAKPFTHPEPIVSIGTAWATMALMRLVPPDVKATPGSPTKE